jgi:hypothetical protein
MLGIRTTNKETYLSYQWIIENSDISINTIENWTKRKIGDRKTFDGQAYIEYNSIPVPSRKKLPSKEAIRKLKFDYSNNLKEERWVNNCYQHLLHAHSFEWQQYRKQYEDYGFSTIEATKYAKEHAVWLKLIEVKKNKDLSYGSTKIVHKAYKKLYPKGYAYITMYQAFKIIEEKGVPALLIKDSRKGNTYAKKFGKEHEAFVLEYMSSGKAYSAVIIQNRLYEYCMQRGLPCPGYTWVKYCVAKHKNLTDKERYGESSYKAGTALYAGIIKAKNPNTAWQCDGWRLPFHMKGFETLNFYGVMDEHSGYIIAYDIAPTENTESILRALNRAVEKTGCLPYEIKTDNHSFNQTKESEYLKATTQKLGMTWTVDSNPRRKGVIERNLGVFGSNFLKEYAGYLGSGIRSKSKDSHVSQQEIDKYHKSQTFITKDEIIYYVAECVRAYNTYVAVKDLGKKPSRKELFENSDQPHKIPVSLEDRMRLFIRESEYKVQRGQINIKRDNVLHEFQLNSKLAFKYNGQMLRVRYESFDEIFLFDLKTDECLGSLQPKLKAHGALADQTKEDIQILNQHTGRIKGYENERYKAQKNILNPDAAHYVNRIIGKKADIEKLEQDAELQREFLDQGGDMRYLSERKNVNESNIQVNKISKQPKEKELFKDKKHSIKKVEVSQEEKKETSYKVRKDQPFTTYTEKISKRA